MPTRRDFLAGAASVLATGLTAQLLAQDTTRPATDTPAPPPDSNQKKLGWGIVGIGKLSIGQILPGLAKCSKSRLVAFQTGHPDKVPPILKQYHVDPATVSIYGYDDYDKIAADANLDILYNVLPNGMHAEHTIKALKAGKHVLCEKPMANSTDECRQMIAAAKETGKKLMIAYRIRRELYNMKAIDLCQHGTFGKPRIIVTDHTFHLGDATAWRLTQRLGGGGAIRDVGIYGINSTRYLSGEEPVSVTGQWVRPTGNPRFKDVEEVTAWTLVFPSGLISTGTASYNAKGTNRTRVIFENGMLDMEPATGYGGITLRDPDPITLPHIDQFEVMMDYFSDCVMNDKAPITPGEEGLQDMRIMEAIEESCRTGKTVNL